MSVVFLSLLIISMACAQCDSVERGADRRTDRTRLKIATFNCMFLFVTNWRTGIAPDGPWSSLKEAQAHAQAIATRLDALDADIVTLLETEDCATAQYVRARMRSGAAYKVFFIAGTDTATGQNIVLLARVDPDLAPWRTSDRLASPVAGNKCGVSSSASGSTTTVSKNLLTRFAVPGFPLFLLVAAHLIARPTEPDRCAQREAQALLIKSAVKAALKDTPTAAVIVLGDFNDLDPAVPDVDDSDSPTSRTLATVKSATTPRLRSTWEFVDAADRWSTCSANCRSPTCSAIDYILASDKILAVADDVGFDLRARNRSCPADTGPSPSDHWPLALVLRAAGAPPPPTKTTAATPAASGTGAPSPTSRGGTTSARPATTTAADATTTTAAAATDGYETLIGQALLPPTCADIGTCGECTTSPLLSCQWCKSNGTDGGESRCAEPGEPCGVQDALLTEDECAEVKPFTCFTVNQILHSCRSCVDSVLNCSWCPSKRLCVDVDSGDRCAAPLAADASQCRALAAAATGAPILIATPQPAGDAFPTWAIAVVVVLVAIIMLFVAVKLVLVFRTNRRLQRRRELQRWAQDTGAQAIHMVPANTKPPSSTPFLAPSPAQSPAQSPPASPRGPPPAKPPMTRGPTRAALPPAAQPSVALPPLRARPMPALAAAAPPPTRPLPRGPQPPATVTRCRALYDFIGTSPDDLSFKAGDEIRLLDTSLEWWRGELNGRVGMLPKNFVERI
jgi:hypothetical protein